METRIPLRLGRPLPFLPFVFHGPRDSQPGVDKLPLGDIITVNLSASLTQVLRWAYWWNSTEDSPEDVTNDQVLIELNTDFSSKGMAAPEIQAIVAAWQAGAISRDTMTDLFRRGEVLPEGRTNEEELKLLAASPVVSVVPL